MAEKMRVFHITKRAEDGKWTVKEEKTDDVLHTFDTRVEATKYCEQFAEEKDALLKYHASKGKNKGRIIEEIGRAQRLNSSHIATSRMPSSA